MEPVVELRPEPADLRGIERLVRTVVDHQHFVLEVPDALLVGAAEGMQGARRFPAHVVADHHDR